MFASEGIKRLISASCHEKRRNMSKLVRTIKIVYKQKQNKDYKGNGQMCQGSHVAQEVNLYISPHGQGH